jgi:dihydroorotase
MSPSARGAGSRGGTGRDLRPARILCGRAWVGGRLQPVEIAIGDDGRIASVGKVRTGARRHDVGEAVILPAATDLHVHLREPSRHPAGESIPTGTIEAALGGVTLVGEMPNTDPPVTDLERLEEKAALVRGRAAVDVLLYALPTPGADLAGLAGAAGAFKIFLSPTTGVEEPPSPGALRDLLERLSAYDLPVAVHAEDPAAFRTGGPARDPAGWNHRRPPAAEARALDTLAHAPEGLRLHVAHVTSADSVRRLSAVGRSFEVAAPHLLLSERSGGDPRFKVNPPLRTEADRQGLWDAYRDGGVPCVASDHAPHPRDAKEQPFERAPSGMPGLETTLPILLARVRSGELSLPVLTATACDRPARWLGQPLGRIAAGHRANLLVVDFRNRTALSADALHAPCGWTPFEGWPAILPREHWRDGEPIVRDGEYVGRPQGSVVRPEFAPAGRRPAARRAA